MSFGTDPHVVERVVRTVRHYVKQPLIVKLSSEVTDITEIAKATVSGGADALEFIMAGAAAVAVGTVNFNNPYARLKYRWHNWFA